METEVITKPPDIPHKHDIIPIHSSDVASFKRCRRYWDWTSPTRSNLRRKVGIHGINFPLTFGSAIHYALEKYYDPILKHDPVASFLTYWNYQWEGGAVGEEWLDRTFDLHPRILVTGETRDGHAVPRGETFPDEKYEIKGLRDLLPMPEAIEEEWMNHRDLGVGMMTFYKDYAAREDDFVVLAAESTYSIPLGFEAIDIREDSPNYNKKLEVHARGKRDAIVWWPEYDKYGLIDHKTAAVINEQYFAKLVKDEQCSNYLWATMLEAELYDLPWAGKMVDRLIYNAIRKNYPHEPVMLSSGRPSLDKQKQSTTAQMFQDVILGNENLEHWFRTDEKAQAFYTYLLEQGDSLFIQRDIVTRNKYEVAATGTHLTMIAREITSNPLIYPNPTSEFRCLQCAFRNPCISQDDGSDWIGMLSEGYEQNRDR